MSNEGRNADPKLNQEFQIIGGDAERGSDDLLSVLNTVGKPAQAPLALASPKPHGKSLNEIKAEQALAKFEREATLLKFSANPQLATLDDLEQLTTPDDAKILLQRVGINPNAVEFAADGTTKITFDNSADAASMKASIVKLTSLMLENASAYDKEPGHEPVTPVVVAEVKGYLGRKSETNTVVLGPSSLCHIVRGLQQTDKVPNAITTAETSFEKAIYPEKKKEFLSSYGVGKAISETIIQNNNRALYGPKRSTASPQIDSGRPSTNVSQTTSPTPTGLTSELAAVAEKYVTHVGRFTVTSNTPFDPTPALVAPVPNPRFKVTATVLR